MITVKIYNGSHYSEPVVKEYKAIGAFDMVEEGARVKCGQMAKTRGRRTWVDFEEDGAPITHRIFQEGFIS
jgi:hypothetical protein